VTIRVFLIKLSSQTRVVVGGRAEEKGEENHEAGLSGAGGAGKARYNAAY